MAITKSGIFYPTIRDVWDGTQLAVDLANDTIKIALFSDSVTPDFGSDTAYGVSPYDSNEVSGGSWSAGGYTLASFAVSDETVSSNPSMVFDWADVSQASSNLTAAMGGLVYDDTLAGNNAVGLVDFVTAVTVNGTFTIAWATPANGGVFYQQYE